MEENYFQTYYVLLMTISFTLTFVVMLAACLCCRRRAPKNELLGLEGMVKLTNPDDVIVVTTVGPSESQADLNLSTTISNADSDKRASTAAHRSLPDIPVTDANGDNGSELYETVADKRLLDAQKRRNKSPIASLKKQASVSQHSSISQADDVSSPYSRVKNLPHDYAKVRSTEHPYAQLHAPSTSHASAAAVAAAVVAAAPAASVGNSSPMEETLNRISTHSDSSQNVNSSGTSQVEIPAASAIAGMISASQDLPYMTPPIHEQQHFSGDSVDSSKGYTSISVREPLANILALQPTKIMQRNNVAHNNRETSDSHYATVSDDSDETYAAIEDPNGRLLLNNVAEIYTSGSETYAQIQPMQVNANLLGNPHVNAIVVSVEINSSPNNCSTSTDATEATLPSHSNCNSISIISGESNKVGGTAVANVSRPTSSEHVGAVVVVPVPTPVDSLRAQMHSRQASSASNNSCSVGNLGSPKPEKRQANSPLPPTPTSKTQLSSARSSVISVIDIATLAATGPDVIPSTATSNTSDNGSPQKKSKSLSPSKDIEGMYAKVMKKNKLSRHSPTSQHSSPVMARKHDNSAAALGVSPLDSAAAELMESHALSMDKNRTRSNSYSAKDHGYETIPADALRLNTTVGGLENRKSDGYAHILRKERTLEETKNHHVTLFKSSKPMQLSSTDSTDVSKLEYRSSSASDKHYETIANNCIHDPGYETLTKHQQRNNNMIAGTKEKKSSDYDPNYEVLIVPHEQKVSQVADDGYAKVLEKKRLHIEEEDASDGYSKVRGDDCEDVEGAVGGYSTIGGTGLSKIPNSHHNYASIRETMTLSIPNGVSAKLEMDDDASTLETESDHYARINEKPTKTRPPELTIISPLSVNSLLLVSKDSSATSSSATMTTTSTFSSRQTPTSSSQYESFTGSDTDPNYESVCYSSAARENSYEPLQPDCTESQLSSSPCTTEESTTSNTLNTSSGIKTANGHALTASSRDLVTEIVVDDYFQV